MPLDLSRPLELDDGTPVQLYGQLYPGATSVNIRTPKYDRRNRQMDGDGCWYYEVETGIFGGGDAVRYYTVRNAGPAPKEEYEDWFVA